MWTTLWYSRSRFFKKRGYALWALDESDILPENKRPRAPDGFSWAAEVPGDVMRRYVPSVSKVNASVFRASHMQRSIQMPARMKDNRDVLIILLTDEIHSPVMQILNLIARGPLAGLDQNHALPLLDAFNDHSLVFGVFPFIGSLSTSVGCHTPLQVLRFLEQVLEVTAEPFL